MRCVIQWVSDWFAGCLVVTLGASGHKVSLLKI
jgi:hypothetical protein